jgi:hypothetical protein
MFVKLKVFETVLGNAARKPVGSRIKSILESGKVKASGVFCDSREGFFIVDVNSGEELQNLLGGGILDYARVESHPIMSFEKLAEFFEREARQS